MVVPLLAALALASGGCTPAAAKAEIARTHLKLATVGPNRVPIAPSQADKLICFDFTRDGRTDMAVTIASGGTAGDVGWVVFVATRSGYRLALTRTGYMLGLYRADGDLVESQPVYRKTDPNCCPTGGFDHARWHWNGRRFAIVRSWHDRSVRS